MNRLKKAIARRNRLLLAGSIIFFLISIFGFKNRDYLFVLVAGGISTASFILWLRVNALHEMLVETHIEAGVPLSTKMVLPHGNVFFAIVSENNKLEYPSALRIVVRRGNGEEITWPRWESLASTKRNTLLDMSRIVALRLPSEEEYSLFVSFDRKNGAYSRSFLYVFK